MRDRAAATGRRAGARLVTGARPAPPRQAIVAESLLDAARYARRREFREIP
jgi:hypothetical protein